MNPQSQTADGPDLREYLRPIWQRRWLVLAVVVVATVGTYLYYASKPKQYTATTQLYTQATELDRALTGEENFGDPDRTARDLAELLTTRAVRRVVEQRTGTAGGDVVAAPHEGKDFVDISVTHPNPRAAARLANAYADALIATRQARTRKKAQAALVATERRLAEVPDIPENASTRKTLQQRIHVLESLIALPATSVEQLDPAEPPSAPSAPHPKRSAAFALVLSLLLAIAGAYILERLDRRVRRIEDVERLFDTPLLATIPHADDTAPASDAGVLFDDPLREAFRTLRTNLQFASLDQPPRTILVTSAVVGEGKSTVVRNLALAYRESGLRVAVVGADLRHPKLSQLFRISANPGLTNVLTGSAELDTALQAVTVSSEPHSAAADGVSGNGAGAISGGGTLTVLTSGPQPPNPPAVLGTQRLRSLFDQVASEYDVVLIDSAPLLAVSDSVPLLSQVDATILVARLGHTTYDAARQTLTLLSRARSSQLLGIVVNDVPKRLFGGGYGYGYGYEQK
jgi:Mrp family chromosome partitioning ATPase/capsular polysaccharide biosynthesis protein